MDAFPTSAADFYRRRDDRTDRCVTTSLYQTKTCVVTTEDGLLLSKSGRVMIIVVANLLSRWCRNVTMVLPATARTLGQHLLAQMRDADPFGTFRIVTSAAAADLHLHLGADIRPESNQHVGVSAFGWYAALTYDGALVLPVTDDANVVGAMAAACLGVAQIFKFSIGAPAASRLGEGVLDLFGLSRIGAVGPLQVMPFPQDLSFGRALMVGAGSVGTAAAYFMALLRMAGELTIVDFDVVKVENMNRSPTLGRTNFGKNKAHALAEALAGSYITPRAVSASWNEFIRHGGRVGEAWDLWLPLANEQDVRWSMANNMPPVMVHGSTSHNWGVNFGRHIPGLDDCLACRFPRPSSETSLRCSESEVPLEGERVDAALPFLSFFAGLLIAAELVRLQLVPYPDGPNYASFDFGCDLQTLQVWNRQGRPGCACGAGRQFSSDGQRYAHLMSGC
jgi:hypothetical protein